MDFTKLNQKQIAEIIGVTDRTVREWKECPRNDDGSYDSRAVVGWYASGDLDPSKQRARKDREQADKLALENAVTRSELIYADDIVEVYRGHVERASQRLIQIPDALGQFCDARSATVVIGEARRLIYEAMEELASDGAASIDRGSLEAAAHPDGVRVGRPEPKAVKRKQRGAGAVAN